MTSMGRWGERGRELVRLDDVDGGPRVEGADVGFYAIWSRSGRRLLVNVTPTTLGPAPQVTLSREQAAQMRDFLTTNPTEITPRVLTLDDADAQADAYQLWLEWWRDGSLLIARITSPLQDSPIGQIDLRQEQLPKLQRFLTTTLQTSR